MTIVAALLACLAVKVIQAIECQDSVTCPCGSTEKNVTVYVPDARKYSELCTELRQWESCEDEFNLCYECPDGHICSQDINNSRWKRRIRFPGAPRAARRSPSLQNCPSIDSPKFGNIRCASRGEYQTCVGKCLPGYHFANSNYNRMILACQKGTWTPRSSFPNCESGGHCDLVIVGFGSFNCTTGMDGTRCDVHCSGRYVGRYFCYPGRVWEPALPHCARPKTTTEGRTACRCKNGGTCDSRNRCICSAGWTGADCDTAVPKKRTCQDPGFIPNGVRRNPDGAIDSNRHNFEEGQFVVYSCTSEEYTLQGSSFLTCKQDGTWSRSVPSCIKTAPDDPVLVCPDPGQKRHANRLNTDGTPSVGVFPPGVPEYPVGHSLVYTCHTGFALRGQSLITCLASGIWSSRTPNCRHITPTTPAANVTQKPSTEQVYCKDTRVDINGVREPNTAPDRRGFLSGARIEYSCEPSYDLIGKRIIFCLTNGQWSTKRPKCASQTLTTEKLSTEQVYCKDTRVDINGFREPNTPSDRRGFLQGSRVEYSCKPGYDLIGERIIFCLTNGRWSVKRPRCAFQIRTAGKPPTEQGFCYDPKVDKNGIRQPSNPPDRRGFLPGTRLKYFCKPGYDLVGEHTLFCLIVGRWSSTRPRCVSQTRTTDSNPLMYCKHPGEISNGHALHIPALNGRRRPSEDDDIVDEYPEGSRMRYSCDVGYILEGSSTLTCQKTGKWSSFPPICILDIVEDIYCKSPGPVANGQVVYTPSTNPIRRPGNLANTEDDAIYAEGSRLQYSCNSGYSLVGRATLICEKSGFWSAERPVCNKDISQPVLCKHPGSVGNARVVHIPPPKARQRPTDETEEEYPIGSQLQYTCDEGYSLEGSSVLYCQNTGNWTARPPTCINAEPAEIMYCENPGLILNGRVKFFPPAMRKRSGAGSSPDYVGDEFPEQSVLEYSCDDGYRRQGRRTLTCQSNGFWSAEAPTCLPDCGRSFMQTDAKIVNGSSTISGDWPWVVSISFDSNDSASSVCGGAVVNTHTVLTAAHCLESGRPLILRFGKHHYNIREDDEEVLVRRSSQIIIHPDYSNRTLDSDIGLVIFRPRIRYSLRVQPICLPNSESTLQNIEPGNIGYVSGWGVTESDVPPDSMKLASLPVVTNEECMNAYSRQNLVITSNMFCAGYNDARQTVCDGDSGSPFVFFNRRIKRYTIEGLVSFGLKGQCGVAGKYAIFTKVFRFVTWIARNWK